MVFPENNLYNNLISKFNTLKLHRKMRTGCYEPDTILDFKIRSVITSNDTQVKLKIVKFVGGGFAGQVYQIKIIEISNPEAAPEINVDQLYAMKILIPPSGFSRLFRDFLYWLGFQGPFQLQVNPTASRAGALWQKFIRRSAGIVMGSEQSVVDIYDTFIDHNLGSCGEISEWIEGRTWLLEVNDKTNFLYKWLRGGKVSKKNLQSPEFRTKYHFMKDFVDMLHQIGAPEFARQYEWSTLKSQPNCLKRNDADAEPYNGLTAVDFRAGLALLPLLPMSPGDFKLIFKGLLRGSLVQFDRGNLKKLKSFIDDHPEQFSDLQKSFSELQYADHIYRNSTLDITHNHLRIFFSSFLWKNILNSAREAWNVQNLIDDKTYDFLQNKSFLTFLLYVINFLPFLGKNIIKFTGHKEWRTHYIKILTSFFYMKKAVKGLLFEILIRWHKQGRINDNKLKRFSAATSKMIPHYPLSILPAKLHYFLSDKGYFKERMYYLFIRPVKLYFDNQLREDWLRDMLLEGRKKNMLSNDDFQIIENQINEPYIQKYLKSLAVHICTVPVTQVVSVMIALIYVFTHPEMPRTQAWGIGVGIIALFQIIPISPGSLVRGLYVVYLVIKERDFKNYNIAVFLGFFKYIGYLAFPIQMTYRYPALARFMAGHWATEAIHIIPVFGESGALLEHWVFDLFYNWPLTIRRQMNSRAQIRSSQKSRYWHCFYIFLLFAAVLGGYDYLFSYSNLPIPSLKKMWWAILLIPSLTGIFVTIGAKGAKITNRILAATITSVAIGLASAYFSYQFNPQIHLISEAVWSLFLFGILSTISAVLTEINLGEPRMINAKR